MCLKEGFAVLSDPFVVVHRPGEGEKLAARFTICAFGGLPECAVCMRRIHLCGEVAIIPAFVKMHSRYAVYVGRLSFLCTMRSLFIMTMSVLLLASCAEREDAVSEQTHDHPKGKLFIIGGGDRGDSLMQTMLEASGWQPGDLVTAITLPSGWGDSAYIWLNDDLKKLTGANCVKFDSAAVHVPEKIDSLRRSKLIFISGGDQNKMMALIAGTNIKEVIREAYRNGAMIAGTSAGASIMSERMLTGDGLIDTVYQNTYSVLWRGNLETAEGLGLLDSVIIDQHFVVRSRYNRLLSAVIEYPDYQAIGIDEGTAILVDGGVAKVIGVSQVVAVHAPEQIGSVSDTLLDAEGIRLDIYAPGAAFPIHH